MKPKTNKVTTKISRSFDYKDKTFKWKLGMRHAFAQSYQIGTLDMKTRDITVSFAAATDWNQLMMNEKSGVML